MTYKFSYVPGVFEDYAEIAKLSPNGKVSTQPSLGILEQVYDVPTKESALNEKIEPQWVQFANYVRHLNKKHAEGGISYKLIYLIRHGRGIHNVKMDELKASEEAGTLEQIDGKLANWKVSEKPLRPFYSGEELIKIELLVAPEWRWQGNMGRSLPRR